MKTNPYKAVSFVQSAVEKALERSQYLIADVKYDGVRGNIVVDHAGSVNWLSRVSKTIPALEHLNGFEQRWLKLVKDERWCFPEGFMLDGELMVKGVDFNTGSGLLRTKWSAENNFFANGNPDATFETKKSHKVPFELDPKHLQVRLYAVLPYEYIESGEDYPVMNLLMKEHVLAALGLLREYFPEIEWLEAESYEVYDMDSLVELYEEKRAEGHEGLIVKDPQGIYRRGKKTGWWKMKPEEEADGIITGLVWGTEGLANEGKVIGFEVLLESGRVVNATNISRALMDEFTLAVQYAASVGEWEKSTCLQDLPNPYEGHACQITYMEETPDGSLRHPSFDKFRGTEDNPQEKI